MILLYGISSTLRKLYDAAEKKATGGETLPAFLVRTARYAFIIFVIIGIYPKAFPLFEKIGKKS